MYVGDPWETMAEKLSLNKRGARPAGVAPSPSPKRPATSQSSPSKKPAAPPQIITKKPAVCSRTSRFHNAAEQTKRLEAILQAQRNGTSGPRASTSNKARQPSQVKKVAPPRLKLDFTAEFSKPPNNSTQQRNYRPPNSRTGTMQQRKPVSSSRQLLNRRTNQNQNMPRTIRTPDKYVRTRKIEQIDLASSESEDSDDWESFEEGSEEPEMDSQQYAKLADDEGEVYETVNLQELNVPYKTSPHITYSVPHPADIIESKSLAAVSLPDLYYHPILPENCRLEDLDYLEREQLPSLSSLQVETISYAGQRHSQYLNGDVRAGYFIADGTGVGKGREASGIVYDNWMRNRKKSVWFTASNSLQLDAKRDITDIGAGNIIPLVNYPKSTKKHIPVTQEGVLFSTYAMLIRNDRKKQLVRWLVTPAEKQKEKKSFDELCKLFDGLIIFDEGHCAKNYSTGEKKESSKTATAVVELQRILPQARILYVSATPASDPNHMGYMVRLGLWGPHSLFPTFPSFCSRIKQAGLSAMELVAMELKQRGCYCSRHLSYSGTRFDVIELELSLLQEDMYNVAAKFWIQKIIPFFLKAAAEVQGSKLAAVLWGAHQRFFLQMILAIKIDKCVEVAREAIENNKAVVIGLFSTGESALETFLGTTGNTTYFDNIYSTCRHILLSTVQKVNCPDSLLKEINELELPSSPLDTLIDRLGGIGVVAEMTGRTHRMVRVDPDDPQSQFTVEYRASEQDNLDERDAFMSGRKNIAIISEAASIGISLQAAKNCGNKKQRVHIVLELPWSADKAIQQLGRTHRSHQESCPQYKMITTPIGGEWRLASMVASRIASLGALTCGERKSGVANHSLSSFHLSEEYSVQAIKKVQARMKSEHAPLYYTEIEKLQLFCESTSPFFTKSSFHKRFLNRLLGISIDNQEIVFSMFVNCYYEEENRGRLFDKEVFDLKAKLAERPGIIGGGSILQVKVLVDRGLTWEQVKSLYDECCSIDLEDSLDDFHEENGFYMKQETSSVKIIFVTRVNKASFHVIFPHLGHQRVNIPRKTLRTLFTRVNSLTAAKELWEKNYNTFSGIGKDQRLTTKILLVGSLFSIFKEFPNLTSKGNLQCVRAEVDTSDFDLNLRDYPLLNQLEGQEPNCLKFFGVLSPKLKTAKN